MTLTAQQTAPAPAPAPGATPGVAPGTTPGDTSQPAPNCRRQRAKALVARLRHKQLLAALSGKVVESAVYAQRAWRIRRTACTCAG